MAHSPPENEQLPAAPVKPGALDPDSHGLNSAQAAAVAHGDTPLLVVAGAGTGKTRTLVHRVAALIGRGVPAQRILLLTFTRRAAQEMRSRVERLRGASAQEVQGGTFHGTANRLLRHFGPAAGLPRDFTILDQADATDLMGLTRSSLGYGDLVNAPRGAPRFPRAATLATIHSRHSNTEIPVPELLGQLWPHFLSWTGDIERCFADYNRRKQELHLLDYDDLLLAWALLLEKAPAVAAQMRALYDHVLVDEYQDTNPIQARILRGLCTNGHITVVGDDAQSIYAFRGATIRNILDFPKQFPDTHIVTLEHNYRSTPAILATSNAIISRARERYSKELFSTRRDNAVGSVNITVNGESRNFDRPWMVTLRDERQQTAFVLNRILELHEQGTPLREMAVLFRAGYLSADLEIELANRHIPFEKWGGLKFLESAHIKDTLAFLRVLENPRDEVSWYRLLRLLPGVGDATAQAVMQTLAQHEWKPIVIDSVKVGLRAKPGLMALAALLDGLLRVESGHKAHNPGESIRLVRQLYDPLLVEHYDDSPARLADLDQLEIIAAGYEDRAGFLAALALEPPAATQDLAVGGDGEDDALILSTVHSAKGREWDAVFIIHVADGVFPMARAADDEEQVEEERRLLYVAATRARDCLYMTWPMNSYTGRMSAEHSYAQLSRFLDDGVLLTMEQVGMSGNGEVIFFGGERRGDMLDGPPYGGPYYVDAGPEVDIAKLLGSRFGE